MKYIKNTAKAIAARISASREWSPEDLAELCSLAGISDEWEAADGDSFEAVAYKAAEILGVDID